MDAVWNSFLFSPSQITGSVSLNSTPEHTHGSRASSIDQPPVFYDTREQLIIGTLKCKLHLHLGQQKLVGTGSTKEPSASSYPKFALVM